MAKKDLVPTGNSQELPQAVADRGYDPATWNTLKNVLYRNASDEAMLMALDYCKARKLDPLKRPIHIVKVWDSAAGGLVETVWQGINELRTTAQRTGQFAGSDEPQIGPMKSQQVGAVTVDFPEYAQVTVYRMIQGQRVPYAGPRVYWLETYAQKRNNDATPNAMWMRRPVGQLVKCAEAAALRAAFPEEIGHEYAAEEMDGQIINEERRHLLQEAGHEPMTLDGEWDEEGLPDEASSQPTPQSPPQRRQPPKAPAQHSAPANGKARADEAHTQPNDAIPFGEDGGEVLYVNTQGRDTPLDLADAVSRLEKAAEATTSLPDEEFASLMNANAGWLTNRAPAAMKALFGARNMDPADWLR